MIFCASENHLCTIIHEVYTYTYLGSPKVGQLDRFGLFINGVIHLFQSRLFHQPVFYRTRLLGNLLQSEIYSSKALEAFHPAFQRSTSSVNSCVHSLKLSDVSSTSTVHNFQTGDVDEGNVIVIPDPFSKPLGSMRPSLPSSIRPLSRTWA
ncbi:hypothetical protein L218DRAFT_708949 [Marasmius fiardii PR-910]|nr:hypothetical protein L218DRAFT_708949 [Marasmius fiardii PR-910]